MRKIPTLFVRDPENRRYVLDEVTPGCEWVVAGEGRPTVKWDGTCVMFDGERWWARREVKPGKEPPPDFQLVEHDETTDKTVGWEPAEQSGFYRWLLEALGHGPIRWLGERRVLPRFDVMEAPEFVAGTYELCGPKINGNPEGFDEHCLVWHGGQAFETGYTWSPTYASLSKVLPLCWPMEGIVFHHPDGRMAKIKARDFPKADE